jgi:hypothetical protein
MVNDIVGLVGLSALLVGVTARFGWDFASIIGGGILLSLAIVGAMRK